MVRKKRQNPIKSKRVIAGTKLSKNELTCIGGICYNPATGKVEVRPDEDSCPPEVIKSIIEGVIKGSEVEFIMKKKKKEVKKED